MTADKDKGAASPELMKHFGLDAIPGHHSVHTLLTKAKEEIELLKIELSSTRKAQKESFEEQDKIIQELKKENEKLKNERVVPLESYQGIVVENINLERKNKNQSEAIQNFINGLREFTGKQYGVFFSDFKSDLKGKDAEILRLQGKVKEAWEASADHYDSMFESDPKLYKPNWDKWSKDNQIKNK